MKNLTWLIFLLVLVPQVQASEVNLDAIKHIESAGCKNPCYGDNGKAVGQFQLHKGAIEDYNRRFKASYSHSQALNPQVARKIASWYLNQEIPRLLRHYKIKDTPENRIKAWNFGAKNLAKKRKVPSSTRRYLKRYKQISEYIK